MQKAYRITVGTAEGASDVYAGEWVESNEQYGVVCDGISLDPRTRYYWRVEVRDDLGNEGTSSSCFETALSDAEWEQATWIGGVGIRRLRKEITLKDEVKTARAYMTGLGYYEFYVNGEKVGDRILDPAYNFAAANMYTKWLHDFQVSMDESGFMTLRCPDLTNTTGPNTAYSGGDVVWTSGVMIIPWDVYQATGDTSVLRENYGMIRLHAQWLMTHEPQPNVGNSMHWDWVGLDKDTISVRCEATGYYYHVMNLSYKIASILGETEDASLYSNKAEKIRQTFNRSFFKGTYYDTNTETVNAIALSFGLVPEEHVDTVLKSLEQVILVDKAGHMTVGSAGIRTLPAALTKYGRPDLTYLMVTQTTYPGLGFMIES